VLEDVPVGDKPNVWTEGLNRAAILGEQKCNKWDVRKWSKADIQPFN
jgi:hypothetical protein